MADRMPAVSTALQRNEAAGYRPISGMAVAALLLAGIAASTVIVIGIMARVSGRPVLTPLVLILAAVSLGLSIAARWHVRRAEGTRTGLGLARLAIWLSILSLGGYGAYFAATDLAVRQQARTEADQFFALMSEGKPELAFRLTRDPGQQRTIEADVNKIRARFGSIDLHYFLQSDLARIFRTWHGKVRVTYTGPGERAELPNGYVVQLIYAIRTPEGLFEADVWTRGLDDPTTGTREWHVWFPKTALRPDHKLTELGRLCGELQLVWARSRYAEWDRRLQTAPVAEVARILQVDGNVPPEGQKEKLAEEVKKPGAINQTPGSSPTRPPGLPTLYFDPEGVRIAQLVQVDAPTLTAHCPAWVTAQLDGPELVKKMLALAGPGWENQPLLPSENSGAALIPYKYEFRVISLDLRPSLPPIAPAPQGS